jgi:hypothetical protein
MNEPFDLPVMHRGEEIFFPAQLKQFGYTHRFVVNVRGTEIFFEPDEERNYRAIIEQEKVDKEVSIELLQAIANAIESIVK